MKNSSTHLIKIGGMQCSFCVESIRKVYSKMDGVIHVAVNLSHEEALIQYDPDILSDRELNKVMISMGYTVRDPEKIRTFEEEQYELMREFSLLKKAGYITLFSLIIMIFNWVGYSKLWFRWIMLSLALLMIFGIGWSILKMALVSLRRGILNQHVLMEFGAFGGLIGGMIGFFIDEWPMADFMGAAIFITSYHILSGYVSMKVRNRSSRAIMQLMNLQPSTATIMKDGVEQEVFTDDIELGDMVRVKPGESIPVDGIVVDGSSVVDQSLVTGEPIPVTISIGNDVIGGSINQYGTLLIRVTKIGNDSFLQQIIRSVQESRALKPGILQTVERVLIYFVPAVLLAALFSFVFWTVGLWLFTGSSDISRAIFATLAVLVMGYPCAIGMATPLSIIRGGGLAAEKGILMRSGEAFQIFREVSVIALDKTGTITEGKPKVVNIQSFGISEERLIAIAVAAERNSEHPLAKAVIEYAETIEYTEYDASEFQAVVGSGVRARIDNREIIVGSPGFIVREGIELSVDIESMESKGWTVIMIAEDRILLGLIAIADTIKSDARIAITMMIENGLHPVLITGDNKNAADFIASQIGITDVFAEVLPHEKADIVRELQKKARVVMVGDGINDAPALMQADIGIAFNTGTDIAIETADIILINNNLMSVLDAYYIANSSYRKTVENVLLAFSFNGIGVPLAMTGLVHPVFAMVAMASSVSAVLLNSYRVIETRTSRLEVKSNKIKYTIPTISCQSCINGLYSVIEPIKGVDTVIGNVEDQSMVVSFSENTELDEIKAAIQSIAHRVVNTEFI